MTEEEARSWMEARYGTDRVAALAQLVDLVSVENARHNMIAPSTLDTIWSRHIVDSAQLVELATPEGSWLDVGTGGGFPGLVVALVRFQSTHLVEPRKLRAAFLSTCCVALGLNGRVVVHASTVERVTDVRAGVISARAVAPAEKLLHAAWHCSTASTRWILPSGRTGRDLDSLARSFPTMTFHVEHSRTDPESTILVAEHR